MLEPSYSFHLAEEEPDTCLKRPLEDQKQFWLYLSHVPDASFAYSQWFERREKEKEKEFEARERRGMDPDGYQLIKILVTGEMVELLESFVTAIGAKRRCVSLVFDGIDLSSSVLSVKAVVTESSIFKLAHPSDVHSNVPVIVRSARQ